MLVIRFLYLREGMSVMNNYIVLSNINYPIGNLINFELQQAKEARIAVAFMKATGIKVIEDSMKQCLKKEGKIEIITGLDFKTTDPQAIQYISGLDKN